MVLWRGARDETDARDWFLEFHCESCKADVPEWRRDCLPQLVDAMREHGLLPSAGSENYASA